MRDHEIRVESTVLAQMSMPYAANTAVFGDHTYVLSAPEAEGDMHLFEATEWRETCTIPTPGGCMDILQLEANGSVFAIMQCYLGYRFQNAGLYELCPVDTNDPFGRWSVERIADVPFAHRLALLPGTNTLLVTTISGPGKSKAEDWSDPGEVIQLDLSERSHIQTVVRGLRRNHGIASVQVDGNREIWVTSLDGVFSLTSSGPGGFRSKMLWSKDVSEIAQADFDGDGVSEYVTIEPFHGDRLCVYRRAQTEMVRAGEMKLSFGHGLWAGSLLGSPSILVGNRDGDGALMIVTVRAAGSSFELQKASIDPGARPANCCLVHSEPDSATIVSTNQGPGTVTKHRLVRVSRTSTP